MVKKLKSIKFKLAVPNKFELAVFVKVKIDNLNEFSKDKLSKVKILESKKIDINNVIKIKKAILESSSVILVVDLNKLRLKTFIDPSQGNNYQSEKALESIINGGFFGKGIGEGVLKERVPEAHTDYIIAVISEEYGAILILGLIFLFLFLTFVILKKLLYEKDEFIKLTLIGLISLILIQAFIHVGVNIRMFPTTGMTFPFLSYGGSSLIGSSITAGIILNFTRKDSIRHFKNE